jgi:hypothetical protein
MGPDKPFSQPDLTWDYSDPVNGPTIPAPFFYDLLSLLRKKNGFL